MRSVTTGGDRRARESPMRIRFCVTLSIFLSTIAFFPAPGSSTEGETEERWVVTVVDDTKVGITHIVRRKFEEGEFLCRVTGDLHFGGAGPRLSVHRSQDSV